LETNGGREGDKHPDGRAEGKPVRWIVGMQHVVYDESPYAM
jgi:hypothetical protein